MSIRNIRPVVALRYWLLQKVIQSYVTFMNGTETVQSHLYIMFAQLSSYLFVNTWTRIDLKRIVQLGNEFLLFVSDVTSRSWKTIPSI